MGEAIGPKLARSARRSQRGRQRAPVPSVRRKPVGGSGTCPARHVGCRAFNVHPPGRLNTEHQPPCAQATYFGASGSASLRSVCAETTARHSPWPCSRAFPAPFASHRSRPIRGEVRRAFPAPSHACRTALFGSRRGVPAPLDAAPGLGCGEGARHDGEMAGLFDARMHRRGEPVGRWTGLSKRFWVLRFGPPHRTTRPARNPKPPARPATCRPAGVPPADLASSVERVVGSRRSPQGMWRRSSTPGRSEGRL